MQLHVSNSHELQRAINAAHAGDTILLARGEYHGVLVLPNRLRGNDVTFRDNVVSPDSTFTLAVAD